MIDVEIINKIYIFVFEPVQMKKDTDYNTFVEKIQQMPLDAKESLKKLLNNYIIEEKRNKISKGNKDALKDFKAGKLNFSSNILKLKEML